MLLDGRIDLESLEEGGIDGDAAGYSDQVIIRPLPSTPPCATPIGVGDIADDYWKSVNQERSLLAMREAVKRCLARILHEAPDIRA